jgi:hypothetical protein
MVGAPSEDSNASGNVDVGSIYLYRAESFSDGFEDCR